MGSQKKSHSGRVTTGLLPRNECLALNLSHPNTRIYDQLWVRETVVAATFPALGLSSAFRRPEHPIRWHSSPYNLCMKLWALVDGCAPGREPVIFAREEITDENLRGYLDQPDGTVARRDETLTPPPRSVKEWS
jgi:hypothetical protein